MSEPAKAKKRKDGAQGPHASLVTKPGFVKTSVLMVSRRPGSTARHRVPGEVVDRFPPSWPFLPVVTVLLQADDPREVPGSRYGVPAHLHQVFVMWGTRLRVLHELRRVTPHQG